MTIIDSLLFPFIDEVTRKSLIACAILVLSGVPLGVFMNLRHMALAGDAMSHAILPGVAIAFFFCGMSVWPMTAGALVIGLLVAMAALFLTRTTQLKEDTSFTLVYLMSLAAGVIMITKAGGDEDLVHILFGGRAVDDAAIKLSMGVACGTILVVLAKYRAMVIECFDSDFLRASGKSRWIGEVFFLLVILNLIAAFQIMGTLMALGLMLLPAIASRFWTRSIDTAIPASIATALVASWLGMALAHKYGLAAGPAVVLVTGSICLISVAFGRYGSLRNYLAK